MSKITQRLPAGHVLVPAAAIGSLSLLLVAGLGALGSLDRLNHAFGRAVAQGKTAAFPEELPAWSVWLVAVVFSYGIAFAILSVPGTWRRIVLWITALILVAGWAPVLTLAARAPEVGAPLIAVVWSGVCALVYAANHRMDADRISPNKDHEAR